MNAQMNIQIRVLSAQARARIRELEAEVAMLRRQLATTGAAMNRMGAGGIQPITKWGNQVQWAGRQLMYNFTLPIVLAGAAATKFALDNERALVRVKKVYGDGSEVMNQLATKEIPALEKAFVALSNRFGVAQADAINIAADWAAAGASGVALAKSVKLTMMTMVLGEMEAKEATEALIAIQAQYNFSTKELIDTIDVLNMVENQTGISMQGLVQGMARSAGVAREMGVDVQHLAAMMAALVPATGSATAAGNGLKTILSRLMAPTNEADRVMQRMGINTKDLAWQSLNATQRLEKMASAYVKLDSAQKIVVASTAASRWQINRFGQLMTDINNPLGYYHRSLQATADSTKNLNQRVRELNTVLESSPQRLKQTWTMLQNTLAQTIQPMIPALLILLNAIAKTAQKFSELDPAVQKLGLAALFALAAIGPLARYVGATAVLLGTLREATKWALGGFIGLGIGMKKHAVSGFAAVKKEVKGLPKALSKMKVGFGLTGAMAAKEFKGMFSSGLKGIKSLFAKAMLPLQRIWADIAVRLGLIWSATLVHMGAAWTGFTAFLATTWGMASAKMISIMAALKVTFIRIWASLQTSLVVLTAAMREAIVVIWGTLTAILPAITGALTAIWAGMQFAWLALATAMRSGMTAIWLSLLVPVRQIGAAMVGIWGAVKTAVMGIFSAKALVGGAKTAFAGVTKVAAAGAKSLGRVLVGGIAAVVTGLAGMITWPVALIGAAVLAAIGVLYNFKDKIREIFQSLPKYFSQSGSGFAKVWAGIQRLFQRGAQYLSDVFWSLPKSIRDAMLTVVRIVQKAVMAVYELFSYLNPFAKHSPSLVDQVTEGMAIIRDQYASVGNVGGIFAKAARDIDAYKRAIGGMVGGAFSDERADVASAFRSALPIFDALISDLTVLNSMLAQQEIAVSEQQAIVDAWEAALDQANITLDKQEVLLDSLTNSLHSLTDAYDAHQQALDDFASAPLQGMMAMEDQIFANEQAQNSLRLEMLKWEQVNGSIDDVQSNMAKLAGSMEALRGEEASLRAAGAGSDILGPIQGEIAAMEAAYDSMGTTVNNSPIGEMQKQLEELQRQGEIMDLEKALKFDSAIREIDKLANAQAELSFDEIVAGINNEKAAMAALEPQIAAATAAVAAQQAAVDKAKASRDAIQSAYDSENAKLQVLKNSYDQTADAIRNIESALNDMASAASTAIQKADEARNAASAASGYLTPGEQNFINAEGGNFPDVTGNAQQIGREGLLTDQTFDIDKFTQETIAEMNATLDKIDMFGPIKRKWEEFTNWWTINVSRNWIRFKNDFKEVWNDLTGAIGESAIGQGFMDGWNGFIGTLQTGYEWVSTKLIPLFGPDFQKIFSEIGAIPGKAFKSWGPELAKFKEIFKGLNFGPLIDALKLIGGLIGVTIIGSIKTFISTLSGALGPAIDMIIGIIQGMIRTIRGIIEVIMGVFTGNWDQVKQGIIDIVEGIFTSVTSLIRGAWDTVWGAVEGLVNGVIDWFEWLADELVGNSIIPDMIDDIIEWIKGLPGKAWEALKEFATKVTARATEAWNSFKDKAVEKWNIFIEWVKGLPQKTWDKLISLKDKLVNVASTAWDAFKTKASEKWDGIISWIKDLPQKAYDKFIAIKDKFIEAGRAAAQGMWDKMKGIIDGKNGFMAFILDLPARIGRGFAKIGDIVANAIKGAWNGAAKWINDNGIAAVNKVTTKFGFTIPPLPTFAGGGVIPGKISKRDNTIIAARTGEGVIVPELVRALGGAKGLAQANAAAKSGGTSAVAKLGIERFADGGIIGKVAGWLQKGAGYALSSIIGAFKQPIRDLMPGKPFIEDWTVGAIQGWQNKAKQWGEQQDTSGNGFLPGIGYKFQEAVLRERFGKNIEFFSDIRPGAITALGNKSMHAMGRAVDMTPRKDIFDWIRGRYGNNTKQLFWSPEDGRTILNGKPWRMDNVTYSGHWDHIHWGYDKGGILPPGNTFARNTTGRNEYTLTAEQWSAFSNVVNLLDRMTLKSGVGATPGTAAVSRVGATLATVEARLRAAETRSSDSTRSNHGGGDTFNFFGDLEFPNIENGNDAREFVKNLRGLAG